mmetsp:Transcript_31289/g.76326  ORF Transcript_31289/g.76326 Transcript_31289/m.76326 type:complete len:263 (-) Transcript_31289:92-880(-)
MSVDLDERGLSLQTRLLIRNYPRALRVANNEQNDRIFGSNNARGGLEELQSLVQKLNTGFGNMHAQISDSRSNMRNFGDRTGQQDPSRSIEVRKEAANTPTSTSSTPSKRNSRRISSRDISAIRLSFASPRQDSPSLLSGVSSYSFGRSAKNAKFRTSNRTYSRRGTSDLRDNKKLSIMNILRKSNSALSVNTMTNESKNARKEQKYVDHIHFAVLSWMLLLALVGVPMVLWHEKSARTLVSASAAFTLIACLRHFDLKQRR